MPEKNEYTPAKWEQAMRLMIEETIPQEEKNRLDAMMSPSFVACSRKDMSLTLSFDNQPWMRNPVGNMHGGMIASVFDITMGSLCIGICRFNTMTPTVSMQISYLRPVPAQERLIVEAHVDHLGKTLLQVTAKSWLSSAPELLTATATATYYIAGHKGLK